MASFTEYTRWLAIVTILIIVTIAMVYGEAAPENEDLLFAESAQIYDGYDGYGRSRGYDGNRGYGGYGRSRGYDGNGGYGGYDRSQGYGRNGGYGGYGRGRDGFGGRGRGYGW